MRKMRKLWAVLLSMAMVLAVMPAVVLTEAWADGGTVVGAFTVTGGTLNTDYEYSYSTLKVKTSTPITIKNTDPNTPTTTDRIIIDAIGADITLAGVNIQSTNYPLFVSEENVTIRLKNENVLHSTAHSSGLSTWNKGLKITSACGDGATEGSLHAYCSFYDGAGIGCFPMLSGCGSGGGDGAGIGGERHVSVSNITISGGLVKAIGGRNSAGIGGGSSSDGSNITISGGTVKAIGGERGAGIGGGSGGDGSNIVISGGSVNAIGGTYGGNAIGGGAGKGAVTPTNGQGTNPSDVCLTTVTLKDITDAAVKNTQVTGLLGITPATVSGYYGMNSMYTDSDGKLYLWFPVGTEMKGAAATAYDATQKNTDYRVLDDIAIKAAAGTNTGTIYDDSTVTIAYVSADTEKGSVKPSSQVIARVSGSPSGTATAGKGYHFSDWTSGSTIISSSSTFMPSKTSNFYVPATYTANFAPNTYEVHFDANGGLTGTMTDEDFTYNCNKELTANIFTRPGYTFSGWNTEADGSGTAYADGQSVSNLTSENNGSVTLYAQWKSKPAYYTITASASPFEGGTVTGGGSYMAGTSATLKAVAAAGYNFVGWYEDGKQIGTDVSVQVRADRDVTVTAHFRMASSLRVSGNDRYGTMAEIVKRAFPKGCDTVVLASGANWPDALAASSLAGAMDCPVLLTDPDRLNGTTAELLSSLGVKNVIIVGGTSSVSDAVKSAVEAKNIATERIWGDDRTQTADRIARRVIDESSADTIIICSGNSFPDALSISSCAFAQKMPILLTGSDGKLTDDSLAIAENFGKAIIIGGENAVSPGVEKQLTVMKTVRYAGDDRYGTSAEIINNLFGGKASMLAVATGQDCPDALVGAALAGRNGGAILLVDGQASSLTDSQKTIVGNAGSVWILGGESAVSAALKTAVDDTLK